MPYLTREGHATSLLIATGPDVTVNTILGLPFIQQTRMVIDASDQVADMCTLDTPPFPIDFRRAMCTVPALPPDVALGPTSSNCAIVLKEIARLEAFFAGNATPTKPKGILLPSKRLRKVGFVAGPTSPASSTSDSSTIISIGSELEPDFALDANGSDLCDVPPSSFCVSVSAYGSRLRLYVSHIGLLYPFIAYRRAVVLLVLYIQPANSY